MEEIAQKKKWGSRLGISIIFLILGLLVFLIGGYLAAIPHNTRSVVRTVLPIIFLATTFVFYRIEHFKKYWQLSYAFFVASFAFLLTSLLSNWLLDVLNFSTSTMKGLAAAKVSDAFPIVLAILLLNKAAGGDLGSIYVQKGNLKRGLITGAIAFSIFGVLFYLQAKSLNISIEQLVLWMPWVLIFVFANAIMEELHFRGLFLRKLEPFLGRNLSNLAVAIVFTITHAPVKYTPNIYIFLVILFALAMAWGDLMQKTDSIWGSVLFHAGADLVIMIGILETYSGI